MQPDRRIVAARMLRGLRQTEVARLAGIDQPHYSRLESGSRPSLPVADRVARALGQQPEVLWGEAYASFRTPAVKADAAAATKLAALIASQQEEVTL